MKDICKPIPIPRGEKRAQLTEAGLTGKIALHSSWNENEVRREVTSLFAPSFLLQDDDVLPYQYLRYDCYLSGCILGAFYVLCYKKKQTATNATFPLYSTIPGGKKLAIPRTSSSFKWNASEVASLAAQGSLYIMAKMHPTRCVGKKTLVCINLFI